MGEGGHRGRAGAIEHEGGKIVEIVEFELFEHRQKSSTACFVTCREAVDVADDLIGFADVPAHHGDEVVVEFASLDPLQDRDAHALLVHLAGLGAVAATPDVDDVRGRCEEADERCVVAGITEDRGGDGDVVKVAGALPGVVRDVDVARVDPFRADVVDEVADGGGHRVDVAGCARDRLGDHPAFGVEDAC